MAITLNGTTGIQNVLGSAAAPAESNTTSSNTGMYFPTSTTLGFSTAGTNAVTIDASQNVGIGTSSPNTRLQVYKAAASAFTGTSPGALLLTDSSNTLNYFTSIDFNTTNGPSVPYARIGMSYTSAGSTLSFGTSNSYASGITNTAMTIDPSGNLLVGTTSVSTVGYGATINVASGAGSYLTIGHPTGAGTGYSYCIFSYNNTGIGSVSQQGTTQVNFNGNSVPPSDQRLKENIVDAPDALPLLKTIQIRSFDWIGDKYHQTFGAIAQELQMVLPEFVPTNENPDVMLGVDYGKMVPMLIKSIQEQQTLITQLTDRIAALEAR
jgi:hypothetical protein